MTIGIALCTYNGAKYLSEQLDSFINQTVKPDIIYVNDDNSQDNTLDILKEYSKKTDIVFDIQENKENLGYIGNFENLLSRCKTDVIFPSDQDDYWLPEKIEELIKPFEDENIMLTFSDSMIADENLNPTGSTMWHTVLFTRRKIKEAENGLLFDLLMHHNVISGHNMAIKRELLDIALPFNRSYEWDYWVGICAAVIVVYKAVDKVLVYYRQHTANAIGAPDEAEAQIPEKILWIYWLVEWTRLKLGLPIKSEAPTLHWRELNKVRAAPMLELKQRILERLQKDKYNKLAIDDYLTHLEFRGNLPEQRYKRFPLIIKEISTKRYRRYSKSWMSIVIDLLRK